MEALINHIFGSAPFYLDEDKSILVFKYGSESDVLLCEKKSGVAAVCLNEYIEMVNHFVIEEYKHHSYGSKVILPSALESQLWCDIYNRYGSQIFKILTGPYQVFQLLLASNSYLQISGRAVTSIIASTDTSIRPSHQFSTQNSINQSSVPSTQHSGVVSSVPSISSPKIQSSKFSLRQRNKQLKLDENNPVIKTLMFTNKSKPKTSPDRLFGGMSYTRWYQSVFKVSSASQKPCPDLKAFHKRLRNIAFSPLIEAFTQKESQTVETNRIFDSMVPHWKIKQLIKRVLMKLKVSSLLSSKNCFKKVLDRLKLIFTSNLYTIHKLSLLTQDIKLSGCQWLYTFTAHSANDRKKHLSYLLEWLTTTICYVIKYFFYVTESRVYRKRCLFFRRIYWETKVEQTFESYIDSKMLRHVTTDRKANTHLRFLPDTNKLRPILSSIKKEMTTLKLYLLHDTLSCLKVVRSDPATGLAKCTDFITHLRRFNRTKTSGRYYFAKADVTKCYDSIDRKLLMKILKTRFLQMNIDKFICKRIAVVRNNSEKPLVSYFTHVDVHLCGGRLSTPSLQDACSDYLQKKGLSSVVFVPVKNRVLSSVQVLEIIESHLNEILIEVRTSQESNHKFAMVDGIPQGSVVSSVLCDIYYGAMEMQYLVHNLQGVDYLLLRNLDDYLLLTRSESSARTFLQTLMLPELSARFSCVVKLEKTLTNISQLANQPCDKFPRSDEDQIQWCQFVINLDCLSINLPFYSVKDIHNGISYDGTAKPFAYIQNSLLKNVCVFSNPIFLDSVINDAVTLKRNITQILRLSAIKFTYLHLYLFSVSGQPGVARNPKLWFDLVVSVGRKLYKIIKNHHQRVGDVLKLDEEEVIELCFEQFLLACGSWPKLKPLREILYFNLYT
ncbi:EST2 [Bugula neritina]|uniref:Telomerase reverse transcriptase n=1 Tax=Bugula neritina TaxID=10212 RepID=A0A7J7IUN8_BUGNE|nr:EST2 [Bugula neritina]